jgi:4-deoxy-L-threo-5-hexosulose-uronate ketol-isomerase
VGADSYDLGARDMIYVGKGEEVSFSSNKADNPAKFYLLSAPAHHAYPTKLLTIANAKRLDLGSQETSNERSIFQFTTTIATCQIVVGMTQLAKGSVWNTMPAHVHDRRMEAYLYFDLADTARVFHFMGEPDETRHIVMANEEAVLSPVVVDPFWLRHVQLCFHLGDGRR